MKYDVGKLEGGYRLFYIQRTKRYLFLAQAAIILFFAGYLVYAGGGVSLKPFFLSINSFIYFVLIMVLVVMLETFIFTILELRFMRSTSAKFIVTRRSTNNAIIWVVVSVLVLLVLWSPILPQMQDMNMGEDGSLVATSETEPAIATLFNSDALGLTEVNEMRIESDGLAEVFIVTQENYDLFKDSGKALLGAYRINQDFLADPDIVAEFPSLKHTRLYILAYSADGTEVELQYSASKNVSNVLMNYLPPIMATYLVVNAFWAFYMYNANKRYVQGIYR